MKRRYISALLIAWHAAAQSQRIMFIGEILRKYGDKLSPREVRFLHDRNQAMARLEKDVLKLAHRLGES